MGFQAWHLAAMEEYGLTNTNEGLINRVARRLADSPNDVIDNAEFRDACIACNVDPDSFTAEDFDMLRDKLRQL